MMKKMKKKIGFILCLLCSIAIFAETTTSSSITAALSLEPGFEYIPGDDHFAPPTKPFGGMNMFVTGAYSATFPISLGDHPIFTGSYIRTTADLMLTPVSASPSFDVAFAPLPFLSFNAGATIGAGWIFGDELLVGIKTYDKAKNEYTASSAFSTMYYDAYIQGNFQFDMAVFFPGDWNHILTMASYKLGYTGITSGGENGNPWNHLMDGSDNVNANGLNYAASVMLGYQMPLPFDPIVGIQADFSGYFFEDDFTTESYDWDPTFMSVALNAVAVVNISDNHSLTFASGFASRRSFDKEYHDDDLVFAKKTVGREWIFIGIALIYTYKF